MLEVGNGGMTDVEYQSHFAMWAILKAPLLIGCDISKMSNSTLNILGNEEVIAISQDKLGKQGSKVANGTDYEIWAGPLADGSVAAVLFNRGDSTMNINLDFKTAGVSSHSVSIRDLINH